MSVIVNGKYLDENDCFLIAATLKANAANWRDKIKSKKSASFCLKKADQLEELSKCFFTEGILYSTPPSTFPDLEND